MEQQHSIDLPGDPLHPEHSEFLTALGEATYAASRVAGICFDVLRVLGSVKSQDIYSDPLGTLDTRLRGLLAREPSLPNLAEFHSLLGPARDARNDLLHALPVKDGLHRRKSNDATFVRNFFTVEDVGAVTAELNAVWIKGTDVLYADGGASVRAWYDAGGS